jgi:hypothetical protein
MNQTILERKLRGDPLVCDLIQILKRSAELAAEDATMTAKEARCFLRIDRRVWDTYRKDGIVTPYFRPLNSRAVYKRVEIERLLRCKPWPLVA